MKKKDQVEDGIINKVVTQKVEKLSEEDRINLGECNS